MRAPPANSRLDNFGRFWVRDRRRLPLTSQRSLPDLRHRRPPPSQSADFELPLFDLLRQFDATDKDHGVSEAPQPDIGQRRCFIRR
jgi:hypothetical protein